MTICTYGRVFIPSSQRVLMNAVQCTLVLILVAAGASGIHGQAYFPAGDGSNLWMRILGDCSVALHTGVSSRAVDRIVVDLRVNGQIEYFPGWQCDLLVGRTVTGETIFIPYTRFGRRRDGLEVRIRRSWHHAANDH